MLRKAYLEISNICNLSCSFCPGTRREPRVMSAAEFRLLAEKLRGHTEYLYFHLMGEPLLHPELGRLLEIAGELGFRVMITTNGTLLPERGALLLAAPALHKVNLSLQSFEANQVGNLQDYLTGCIDFVKRVAEKGVLCESFPEPWGKSRNGERLAQGVWLDPGERFDWPDLSLDALAERGFCYGLRDQIGVLADGTVVPCCLDHEGDIPLGNLFHQSLDEILAGDRARAIYEGFSRRVAVEPLCKRCGYARRFDKE